MVKVKSFEVSTGEHWIIRLSARDAAGLPLDLTDGFGELGIEGNGVVKIYDGIIQDAEAGTIDFIVSPSDHIDVIPGEYLYEILITLGSGIASTQARGILTVLEGAIVANAPLAAGSGYYQITGLGAELLHSTQILTAGASSYAITGTDATLKHANLTIGADSGSYAITGTNVVLAHANLTIGAGAGSYLVTGTDAALMHALTMAAGGGSYALTGTDASLVVAAIDPSFSSVVSLLHFEGADNSTTYTDQTGKTWTAHNIAVIDTAQFKFGTSSGLFQRGATIYIDTPHSTDWNFGSGDFTVECWVRWNDLTGSNLHGLIFHDNPSGTRGWGLYMNDAGSNQDLLSFFGNFGGSNKTVTDTVVVTTGQWYHIAAVRDGNTLRLYKDGVQRASDATLSGSIGAPSEPLAVGCQWGNGVPLASSSLDGWIDDLRITKGVCRYPSGTTFTPPTAAFPDS